MLFRVESLVFVSVGHGCNSSNPCRWAAHAEGGADSDYL